MRIIKLYEELYSPHSQYWVVVEYMDNVPVNTLIFPDKANAEDYVLKAINDMIDGGGNFVYVDKALKWWNSAYQDSKIELLESRFKTDKVELEDWIKERREKDKRENQFDL